MSYTVCYKSRLGRAGRVEVERPEDARRVVERVVRTWDDRDRPIELRFVKVAAVARKRGPR